MVSSLYVRRWGRGPEVVFLHGLGASSRYWQALAQDSSGYAATAPDLLGFGRSPSPPDAPYDVAQWSSTSGPRGACPCRPRDADLPGASEELSDRVAFVGVNHPDGRSQPSACWMRPG
ncbi:MAG: alpha/beta hydrolase [Actinomycetota bacterium]|nr:alpha/beta hydrolase [Actinomycetota bacterium]